MRKLVKIISAISLSLLLCIGIASCKNSETTSNSGEKEPVHQITLLNEKLSIALYDSKQINYDCDIDVNFESKNPNVLSVSATGVVTALQVGTAEVVVSNAYDSATVAYTVIDTGNVPYLKLSIDETLINLTVGDSLDLTATLLFKGEEVDAEIEYVSDNACVTVTDAGKLTAVSEGRATVTTRTVFFSQEVLAQLTVNVVDNSVFLHGVEKSYTLCTWSDGEPETVLLPTQVNENGTVKNVAFTYTYDETLLTNTGNAFFVKNKTHEGIIPVTMRYTNEQNKTYDFVVNVQTQYKRIDLRNDGNVYRVGSSQSVEGYIPKFMYTFDNEEPVKILLEGMDLDYDTAKHTYNLDKINNGVMEWQIVTASGLAYQINVTVSDFVLNTPQDVHAVLPTATRETIYLGNDIDMQGSEPYKVDKSMQTNKAWFSGTLDGQGYTIKNLVMNGTADDGGLFFTFLGTVKNIAFTNVDLTTTNASYVNSVIGVHAGGVLENVYVEAFTNSQGKISALYSYLRPRMSMVIRNVAVKFENRAASAESVSAVAVNWNTITNEDYEYFTIENVYAVSNVGLIQGSDYNADDADKKITKIQKLETLDLIEKIKNDEIESEQLEVFLRANFDCVSVDLSASTNYYVETGMLFDGTVVDGHAPVFNEKINGTTSKIVSIKDGANVLKENAEAELDLSAVTVGTRVWTVAYETGESYLVTVNVINVKIKTAQDVLAVLPKATGEIMLLANDIDMNGATYVRESTSNRFSGTLDGQGYAIKNMNMDNCLFAQIEAVGTIKNIQFVNITLNKEWRSVIAEHASGVLENVFVQANAGGKRWTAGLYGCFRADIPLIMRNVVVVFESTQDTSGAICACWNNTANENDRWFTWENVYVISNVGFVANIEPNSSSDNNVDGTPITKIKKVTEAELVNKVQEGEIAETLASLIAKNYDCSVSDLTASTNYYVETGVYNTGVAIDGHAPIFNVSVNNNTSGIASIKDGMTVIKADKDSAIDVNSLTKGVRTWTVKYENGDSYLVTVNVVNAVLKTPSDVLTILPNVYDDYIVLGNDIDMAGVQYANKDNTAFLGIFDGCGYAIKNLSFDTAKSGNGLFKVGSDFTLKNLALTGVQVSGSWVGIITNAGQAKLENVFVEVTDSGSDNGLFSVVQKTSLSMTNVAIVYNVSGGNRHSAITAYVGDLDVNAFTFENVYVLSTAKMYGQGANDFANVERVADKQALKAKASDNAIKGSVLASFIAKYVTA